MLKKLNFIKWITLVIFLLSLIGSVLLGFYGQSYSEELETKGVNILDIGEIEFNSEE